MHQVALMQGGRESPRMGREEGLLRALLCHHVLKQHGERTLEHPEICPHTSQRGSGRTVKSRRRHVCPLTSLGRRDCRARPDSSLKVKRVVLWPRGLTQNTATAPSRAIARTRSAGAHTKPTR